jgi:hypothetical protein
MEDGEAEGEVDAVSPTAPTSYIVLSSQPAVGSDPGEWFVERAKYIPLRLTLAERKYLRLLDAAMQVSEYTDKIDTLGFGLSKAKRIVHQIRELCAILSGLVLAADYKQGQELFTDRNFASNADFYQMVFELGRRHKIMNPDKMRTTYGKLVYLLQVRPQTRSKGVYICVLIHFAGQPEPRSARHARVHVRHADQDGVRTSQRTRHARPAPRPAHHNRHTRDRRR